MASQAAPCSRDSASALKFPSATDLIFTAAGGVGARPAVPHDFNLPLAMNMPRVGMAPFAFPSSDSIMSAASFEGGRCAASPRGRQEARCAMRIMPRNGREASSCVTLGLSTIEMGVSTYCMRCTRAHTTMFRGPSPFVSHPQAAARAHERPSWVQDGQHGCWLRSPEISRAEDHRRSPGAIATGKISRAVEPARNRGHQSICHRLGSCDRFTTPTVNCACAQASVPFIKSAGAPGSPTFRGGMKYNLASSPFEPRSADALECYRCIIFHLPTRQQRDATL